MGSTCQLERVPSIGLALTMNRPGQEQAPVSPHIGQVKHDPDGIMIEPQVRHRGSEVTSTLDSRVPSLLSVERFPRTGMVIFKAHFRRHGVH